MHNKKIISDYEMIQNYCIFNIFRLVFIINLYYKNKRQNFHRILKEKKKIEIKIRNKKLKSNKRGGEKK